MPRLIDGHTHVFNVGFLPVEGILHSRKVPRWLARITTNVLLCLLERERTSSLAEDQFMAMLRHELQDPSAGRTRQGEDDWFARYADAVPASKIAELSEELGPDLDGLIDRSVIDSAGGNARLAQGSPDDITRRRLELLFRQVDAIAGPVETEGGEAMLHGPGLKGIMKWLSTLVQHESRIVEAFPGAWTADEEVAGQVHIMMDMDLHYRRYGSRDSAYPVAEQLERMLDVRDHATAPLFGFCAFDPFRDDGLAIVRNAMSLGFAGVKFYPPNGYRPIGNTAGDIEYGPPPSVVDERNVAFFRWCVEEDVPVFTHCTLHGVESRPGSGQLSHPDGWARVLATPGLENLRLCLGHAGGEDGWVTPLDAQGDVEWRASCASRVFELCVSYPNVYCDFGYFSGLLEGHGARLAARLGWAIRTSPVFAKKCCYGTDWHLMTVQKHARNYPRLFREALLEAPDVVPHVDDFMYGNTLRFLDASLP
jgi:hypothetical protein